MRHAEAKNDPGDDFNRVLSTLGNKQAKQAALFLKNHQIDKVLVSYVKRNMQTLSLVALQIPRVETEMVTELYEGTEEQIIELISCQDDLYKHILVIGHNPKLYHLILSMIDKDDAYYEEILHDNLSPAQIVIIDFPILHDWQEIRKHKGKIIDIFVPNAS